MAAFTILSVLGYIPGVLVPIAGLVAALVFWRKAEASALWAVVGFAILLLVQLFGLAQGPVIAWSAGALDVTMGMTAAVFSMVLSLIRTVGLACILVALVAAWRSRDH
mgnify:CR=1 FL=1